MITHKMRQQFNSRNNKSKILKFQKSGATASFITITSFTNALRRPSFKFFNGVETTQIASDGITYTGFTSDTAIRDIEMRFYTDTSLNLFRLENDNLYGNIDFSSLSGTSENLSLRISGNPKLTGVTNVPPKTSIFYCMNSNLTGNLIFSSTNIGDFRVSNNINLTGITHTNVTSNIGVYDVSSCNLTGNLNLTPLPNLGGFFQASFNSNLTGITHSPSSNNMNTYQVTNCGIIGNHDLTMFPNLGSSFNMSSNLFLTGITHTYSSRIFSIYNVIGSNLTGNHNLSMFPNLGGSLNFNQNTLLTGITHTASTINILNYIAVGCNLIGTLDLSMLNLGVTGSTSGFISLQANPNLNNVIFPNVSNIFRNNSNSISNYAFVLKQCNFDYVDFKPLSGSTLLSGASIGLPAIELQDNNMNAGDVNHILDDFKTMAINNPSGWSNIRLFIGGTNSDPDSSSGGFNGISAISTLTGSPYNWTITY